jgi:hypothetical protein
MARVIADAQATTGSSAGPLPPQGSPPDPDQAALQGLEILISTLTGATFRLSSLFLAWTGTPAVQYGACWDYRGWTEQPDPVSQLSAHRQPDSLTIAITNLRVRLKYEWVLLEQDNKRSQQPDGRQPGQLPQSESRASQQSSLSLGSLPGGTGSHDLAGLVYFKLDVRALPHGALSECKGKLEAAGLQVHPDAASGLFPGLAATELQPYMPILASELASLLCYGNSTRSHGTASPPRAAIRVADGASPNLYMTGIAGVAKRIFSPNHPLLPLFDPEGALTPSSPAYAAYLEAEAARISLRGPASAGRVRRLACGGGAAAAMLVVALVVLRRRRDGGRRIHGSSVLL